MATIVALLVLALASSACGGGRDEARSAARDRALIAAARAGEAERVRSLLESGADLTLATPAAPPPSSPPPTAITSTPPVS